MARRMDAVEVAKEVRGILRRWFDGTKFSVRTSKYAGGASIDIRWQDGPSEAAVLKLVRRFEGASFDGMIDLKTYNGEFEWRGENVTSGADWIMCHRGYTPATLQAAAERVVERYGLQGNYEVKRGCESAWIASSPDLDRDAREKALMRFDELVWREELQGG